MSDSTEPRRRFRWRIAESLLALAVLALGLLFAINARAGDFVAGCEAFDRGDFNAALEEWQPLADKGHAQAQFRIGCLYTFGQGVEEDYDVAFNWFSRAAAQGDPDAMNNLGGLYAEGLGTKRDLVAAFMWFELSARQGHEMARMNRSFVGQKMTEAQIDEAVARAEGWEAEANPGPGS